MNTEKILKEARIIAVTGMALGVLLVAVGVVLKVAEIQFVENDRALIGLSFLPFTIAAMYIAKIILIKKAPHKMKSIILNESDERLVALKNESDAKAFKITQAAIFLCYMGYTLMVPNDIFESVGWWLLLILLFITFLTKDILGLRKMRKSMAETKEQG